MNTAAKKRTLRMFSNGMYVMTSRWGDRYGAATVTWVSQACFKPCLIMAAVRPESNVFRCLVESGVAAIHIVASDQEHIARKFIAPTDAGRGVINGEPFCEGYTSAPILENLPAYVECRVRQIVKETGDHSIVILEVISAACRERVRPLTIAESPWEYGG